MALEGAVMLGDAAVSRGAVALGGAMSLGGAVCVRGTVLKKDIGYV